MRVAAMMLAGAFARVVDPDGEAVFATKGGIAMELWMGGRARATRDIDIVLGGDPDQLAERLDTALREPYNGFTFRCGEIDALPARPNVKKVKVQISFAGRILSSPQLEIAPMETGHEEFVAIPATKLDAVGLDGPDVVLVLAKRWQIAQKLHAVTEQPADGRENPRFRDLIDLQRLEALDSDPAAVRDACERVFAARAQQSWPPTFVVHASWDVGYAALAAELDFDVTDVEQAASAVRAYIERISSA
ncbi:MAG TPA: nucleotidyl transferase AbiEii/AbiGii toxin family protein [Solirubrobacter sp.]|nr:nucleotidyl transferase AbiEii/AbiGii toxin family protein [Solirubrobacter sp.]